MEPLLVKIPEACRILNVGRSKFYELREAGEVEVVKVGGCALVPRDSLVALVTRLRQSKPEVEALAQLVDADGRIDVAEIPAGTSLADLEAVKALVAARKAVPA